VYQVFRRSDVDARLVRERRAVNAQAFLDGRADDRADRQIGLGIDAAKRKRVPSMGRAFAFDTAAHELAESGRPHGAAPSETQGRRLRLEIDGTDMSLFVNVEHVPMPDVISPESIYPFRTLR